MLANLCRQTQIGVCERHSNILAMCGRQIEPVSILAKFFLACCCVFHTHQLFAGGGGRLKWTKKRIEEGGNFFWVSSLES